MNVGNRRFGRKGFNAHTEPPAVLTQWATVRTRVLAMMFAAAAASSASSSSHSQSSSSLCGSDIGWVCMCSVESSESWLARNNKSRVTKPVGVRSYSWHCESDAGKVAFAAKPERGALQSRMCAVEEAGAPKAGGRQWLRLDLVLVGGLRA